MRNASGTPTGAYVKNSAPIGGGGFLINLDQSADGLRMVHGADVSAGGYIRNSTDTKWYSMFSPLTLLSSEYDPFPALPASSDGFRGMPGVRIAPSDKTVIYSFWGNLLFKSIDGGVSQRRTSFGTISALSNNTDPQRYSNPMIDIHPTDPLTVLTGSNHYAADVTKSGAFYSTNGATTAATKIAGLPAAVDRLGHPDRYLVAFDPGAPANVYVHVGGVGLYQSTTGVAGAFSAIASSPVRCTHLIVTAAGMVYCAGGANAITNDLYQRTRAGVASSFTTTCGTGALSVAVDPGNAARIVCCDDNGSFGVTYNSGAAWENLAYFGGNLFSGTGEIAWLSNGGGVNHYFPGMIKFDNAVASKLWMVHGTGVAYCTVPAAAGSSLTFHDLTQGNEEKVAQSFLSVAGAPAPILGNWDYSFWRMNDLKRWNNKGFVPTLVGGGNGLAIAQDMDVSANDPNYWVGAVAQSANSNAYSTDNGKTWLTLPGQTVHPYGTGAIAVNQKVNIITIGSNAGLSLYTLNGGTSWSHLQIVAGIDTPNMINALYLRRKIVTADKTRPLVFSVVIPGIIPVGTARADAGLYLTLDGGATWTQKIAGIIGSSLSGFTGDTRQYYTEKLKYIPGFSGEMLHCCHEDLGPDFFHWLTNDGATIARIGTTVTDVVDFDFGPIMTGQTRPSVGFYGKVGGIQGVYVSLDWFATAPVLVTRFPLDNLSGGGTIGMDKNRLRVFAGGIGWNYFDLTDLATGT